MSGLFDDDKYDPGWTVPLGWKEDNIGNCRSCGAEVLWCITKAGKKAPVDRSGESHFVTCPQRDAWRKPR